MKTDKVLVCNLNVIGIGEIFEEAVYLKANTGQFSQSWRLWKVKKKDFV